MDKTNFTVAIIPIGASFGWSPTVAGLVQSAFFYGFLAMQVPGGLLSVRMGGRNVLPRGLAVWSTATALIPLVAGNMTALCATRAVMGAGEAVAPSSIIDMISRSVPAAERASAVSFAFAGLHVGSIIGLIASPAIITSFGWPALFYLFGGVGALWLFWFENLMRDIEQRDPELYRQLLPAASTASASAASSAAAEEHVDYGHGSHGHGALPVQPGIPYRAFLRSRPVRALAFTHFAHNWFHFTMLSWLPTYFTSTLSVDLMHAAQTALLPPIAGIVASAAAGTLGDGLIARGAPLAVVRKGMQGVSFLLPTAFLLAATQVPCTPEDSTLAVACITAALGLSSFSLAGLYCTHGDMSTKYASALLGLTNVAGSVPGIIGVATVGMLYDATGEWSLALFMPSAVLMVIGAVVYTTLASNDPIDFDAADNSPFQWETELRQKWEASPFAAAARAFKALVARQ